MLLQTFVAIERSIAETQREVIVSKSSHHYRFDCLKGFGRIVIRSGVRISLAIYMANGMSATHSSVV